MTDKFFENLQARLLANSREVVDVNDNSENNCTKWQGALNKAGYGTIHLILPNKKKIHTTVHRAAYMLKYKLTNIATFNVDGERLEISHLCHSASCINTSHLTLEPAKINRERQICCTSHVCLGHKPECMIEVR